MRITIIIAIASLALLAGANHQAQAHAMLDHAEPGVNKTIHKSPREIDLWFTEDVEPGFTGAIVRDVNAKRVDIGKAQVDHADHTLLRVRVKPLKPGKYDVHWHALSVDSHHTQGDFLFYVAK
jgi:copper resistance protein C